LANTGLLPAPRRRWKKRRRLLGRLRVLAERTGLEPATLGVTGRYSNQLNYRSMKLCCVALAVSKRLAKPFTGLPGRAWWVLRVSNPRPSPCKGDALPLS